MSGLSGKETKDGQCVNDAQNTIKLPVGRIEYLNVLPVYHGMECGAVEHNYELAYAPPSTLNGMMERSELVASSTSCVEYAKRSENYFLLPNLAIVSKGPVQSVLLISRLPLGTDTRNKLEQLKGKTILLSSQSHTSVALLKLLLKQRYEVEVEFSSGSAAEATTSANPPDAILTIGDEALRLRKNPDYPYILDLGEAWLEWTGLPFVYALWVIGREAVARLADKNPKAIAEVVKAHLDSKNWGQTHMQEILDYAQTRYEFTRQELSDYFAGLYYELGPEEQKGLRLFMQKLHEIGELQEVPELEFYPTD